MGCLVLVQALLIAPVPKILFTDYEGLGMYFLPEMQFGYEAFCVPLIYGAVGTIPNVVMYSRKELKVKEVFVRKFIQLTGCRTG